MSAKINKIKVVVGEYIIMIRTLVSLGERGAQSIYREGFLDCLTVC